jgi:hypothetical protein
MNTPKMAIIEKGNGMIREIARLITKDIPIQMS